MREEEIKKALEEKFSELYGNTEGIRYFFAPGRVNLIGEHRLQRRACFSMCPQYGKLCGRKEERR